MNFFLTSPLIVRVMLAVLLWAALAILLLLMVHRRQRALACNRLFAGGHVVLAVLFFTGLATAVAFAQGLPTDWLASPNGQEQIGVTAYNPGAQIANVSLAAVRDAVGYSKQIPLTGASITVGGAIGCNPQAATAGVCTSVLQLTPAGTLSTLTIKTPLYPIDGQKMQIFSTQIISTLTMTASQSQTLNGGLTSLSANAGGTWLYSAGSANNNGTWDRIN